MSYQEPLYYRLTPVYPPEPGCTQLVSAAIVTCMATGRQLNHCGGGSRALSPEIVKALDRDQNGDKARAIVDAQDWDNLRGCLGKLVSQFDERGCRDLSEEIALNLEAAEQLIERTKS